MVTAFDQKEAALAEKPSLGSRFAAMVRGATSGTAAPADIEASAALLESEDHIPASSSTSPPPPDVAAPTFADLAAASGRPSPKADSAATSAAAAADITLRF
jgi:hypothetical protein